MLSILSPAIAHGFQQNQPKQRRTSTRSWLEQIQAAAQRLKSCKTLSECLRVREEIERSELGRNVLMESLGKFGELKEAAGVFQRLRHPNVFSWNILLAAYARNGHVEQSRLLFDAMAERDVVSWTAMLSAYAQRSEVDEARSIFDQMPERNHISWNTMLLAYAWSGHLSEAELVFCGMPALDVISWTLMMVAYAHHGHLREKRFIFDEMPERDVVAWTAMLYAYVQTGDIISAQRLFHTMPDRNVVSWNAMLQGCAHNGVLELVSWMNLEGERPDYNTFIGILHACSHLGLVEESVRHFASIVSDHGESPSLEHHSCMVDILGRVGELDRAEDVARITSEAMPWSTLTGAAKMHGDLRHGIQSAKSVSQLNPENSTPYVLQLHHSFLRNKLASGDFPGDKQ